MECTEYSFLPPVIDWRTTYHDYYSTLVELIEYFRQKRGKIQTALNTSAILNFERKKKKNHFRVSIFEFWLLTVMCAMRSAQRNSWCLILENYRLRPLAFNSCTVLCELMMRCWNLFLFKYESWINHSEKVESVQIGTARKYPTLYVDAWYQYFYRLYNVFNKKKFMKSRQSIPTISDNALHLRFLSP